MKLTRKGFRAWLAGHEPEAIVGVARSRCRCPLAIYIGHSINPVSDPSLPIWADRFVGQVDSADLFAPITASRALEILDMRP